VGRDTRLSGPMLEGALVAGLCSAGAEVRTAGVIPTPAVAFLVIDSKAAAGGVLSASHNPVADNGIKFFSAEGLKISADVEDRIEALLEDRGGELPIGVGVGSAQALTSASERYLEHLLQSLDGSLSGIKIVLDCAHGAASEIAPRVFREAGAEVVAIHDAPDGARINVDCGSTSMAELSRRVVAEEAQLGLGFDGDADRVLAVDELGASVDGDRIIGMTALRLQETNSLVGDLVVTTVMSNLGLRRALEERGILVEITPVGDRHVVEAMTSSGAVLGGEQSGHIILGAEATTGDGILTGLHLTRALAASRESLSTLAHFFEPFPQVLINVEVAAKDGLAAAEPLWEEVQAAERALGEDGRVLIRPSGTEPLIRVMVEAADVDAAKKNAEDLAATVKRLLGGP
jgi:phosphoglucosamine mutase